MVLRTAALATFCLVLAVAGRPTFAQPPQRLFDTWIGSEAGWYPNAASPECMTIADLDADGRPDAVVGYTFGYAPGIAVLRNLGAGAFAAPVRYPLASQRSVGGVAVGDFDGDGHPDVVATIPELYGNGSKVAYYRNHGDGTLDPRVELTVGPGPVGIVVADFDGDGRPDIAAANYGYSGNGATISLIRKTASGFAPAVSFPAGPGPYRLAAADLDGDGRPDLVVTNAGTGSHQISVLINNAAGGFSAPVAYPIPWTNGSWSAVALADMDHDGDIDIVTAGLGATSGTDPAETVAALLLNNSDGTFGASRTLSFGSLNASGPADITLGDLNGDGFPDVLGVVRMERVNAGLLVLLSDGFGGFGVPVRYPAGDQPAAVLAADINGDGHFDPIVLNAGSIAVNTYLNTGGSGVFPYPVSVEVGPQSTGLAAGDFSGDGAADIAACSGGDISGGHGGITLLTNAGDGTFYPSPVMETPYGAAHVKIRDLDGDGVPDLVWMDSRNNPAGRFMARWARNFGGGSFGEPMQIPMLGQAAAAMEAIDVDGDGDLDIVAISGSTVMVSRNNGDGTFTGPVGGGGAGGESMAIADFNRDGALDVATTHASPYGYDNTVSIILGTGDGSFVSWATLTTGQGPIAIAAGDFNGDGIPDLVTADSGSDRTYVETISVLIGRGDGHFLQPVQYPRSFSPDLNAAGAVLTADVDGDGHLDILVSNSASNDISFFRGRGNGTLYPQVRYGADVGPTRLLFTDFTGDHGSDLVALTGHTGALLDQFRNQVTLVRGLAPAAPTCRVDVNGDGAVTVQDFLAYLQLFSAADPLADLDADRAVNIQDFLAFLQLFAAGCP